MRRLLTLLLLAPVFGSADIRFSVSFPKAVFDGPFSGRVVVYLSKRSTNPMHGPNWFSPEPMYSAPFKSVGPGSAMVVSDGNATVFPGPISSLPAGEYKVQAVVDRNLGGRAIGESPGNLYSATTTVQLDPKSDQVVTIVCDQTIQEPKFVDTEAVKGIRMESKLLSAWYGRPTFMKAAVVLPEEYDKETNRKFPIYYEVPGFGGDAMGRSGSTSRRSTVRDGEPFIYVQLDPSCPTGHCVFADSDNNGPWGKALTTELIPEIERRFRTPNANWARYVGGHSSGGWSSLWLQVTYPDVFGGCWSTSPDPVDFRDFQRIDLYKPGVNMFTDEAGKPRPIARFGDTAAIFYKPFSDMERPIRGEQLGSFEGVFSPRGVDGDPQKLWNRDTGAVDPKVADTWKRYDIGLILRTHWKELEPKLKGKVHLYMGDMDTFYLEGAVKLLQKDMKAIGADCVIELFPGDHGSVMTKALRDRIDREMAEQFRKGKAAHQQGSP